MPKALWICRADIWLNPASWTFPNPIPPLSLLVRSPLSPSRKPVPSFFCRTNSGNTSDLFPMSPRTLDSLMHNEAAEANPGPLGKSKTAFSISIADILGSPNPVIPFSLQILSLWTWRWALIIPHQWEKCLQPRQSQIWTPAEMLSFPTF